MLSWLEYKDQAVHEIGAQVLQYNPVQLNVVAADAVTDASHILSFCLQGGLQGLQGQDMEARKPFKIWERGVNPGSY